MGTCEGRSRRSTRRSGAEVDFARHSQIICNATLRLGHCTACCRTNSQSSIRPPRRCRRDLQQKLIRKRGSRGASVVERPRPHAGRGRRAESNSDTAGAVMGATRDKEREAHWRRNKELRKKLGVPGAVVSIAEIDKSIADFCRQHWQPGWEEARRARGPELVRTLLHLAREWNDKRFVEAVKALTELQLVDEGYGFIPGKRGPGLADLERQISARKQQLDDEQI